MTISDMIEQIKKDFCLEVVERSYSDQTTRYNFSNLFFISYYRQNPRYVNIRSIDYSRQTDVYVGKTDFFYKKIKKILSKAYFMQEHIRKVKIEKIKEMIKNDN